MKYGTVSLWSFGLLMLPDRALAAWGENWGEMVWGLPVSVPSVPSLGLMALALALSATAARLLRKRRTGLGLPVLLALLAAPFVGEAQTVSVPNTLANGSLADADAMNENFAVLEAGVNDALTTGSVSVPHVFTNGTTADADEVNANFTELEAGVNTALANRETDCLGAGGTWDGSLCTPAANNGILNVPAGSIIANNYFVGPNADLSGANLDGADLTNANLSGANLDGADLTNTDLTMVASGGITGTPTLPAGFMLTNGYLVGPNVNLSDEDLNGADLTGADLSGANLSGAILTNADLNNANLTGANLIGVVSGGIFNTPWALPANVALVSGYLIGPNVNLTDANLNNTNLTSVTLTDANLSDAQLFNTNLSGVDLSGADLSGADLGLADLTNAVLTNATLTAASFGYHPMSDIYEATLTGITSGGITGTPALPTGFLFGNGHILGPGVNLTDAYLHNLDLTSVNLSGTNLTRANLTVANLTNANLTNTNLTDANLIAANLTHANLAESILTNANLANATYNASTLFPPGFDPVSEGMLLVP